MHGCAAIIPLFALVACSVQAIGARQRDLAGLPHAVMICLDGFRHDYADRYHAVHLRKVGDDGASAALIPVYPSATYPSMYSLATGLRPANHGIVDAAFHDPLLSKAYDSRDASAVDPAWYGGTPLWKLAEQHGVRASVLTWVGYSRSGSAKHPDAETQLAEVMRLLGLPEPERPRLVMMYFADIDSAGHRYGPQSPEVGVAVRNLDEKIGRLRAWIQSLQFPVNLIIVSDHGMAELREVVFLEDLLDLRGVTVSGRGTQALLYFSNREAEGAAYRSLKRRAFGFAVYRRTETPARLRYRGNARIGNLW
jgi:predicted AlkP superfamily pyrophosphatase or phosphodiesterase